MSNYIQTKGDQIVKRYLNRSVSNPDKLISLVQNEINSISSIKDRVYLLTMILEANEIAHANHKKGCNTENCGTTDNHDKIEYFLGQELSSLGIVVDEDAFTTNEKANINVALDEMLAQLKDLKDGQQLIYDDLMAEIEQLKNWYILGKKNWKALYIGKIAEMVSAGIIGETVSKPLLEAVKDLPNLLTT